MITLHMLFILTLLLQRQPCGSVVPMRRQYNNDVSLRPNRDSGPGRDRNVFSINHFSENIDVRSIEAVNIIINFSTDAISDIEQLVDDTCPPGHDPALTCTRCFPNYDPAYVDCTRCRTGYDIDKNCTICRGGFNENNG